MGTDNLDKYLSWHKDIHNLMHSLPSVCMYLLNYPWAMHCFLVLELSCQLFSIFCEKIRLFPEVSWGRHSYVTAILPGWPHDDYFSGQLSQVWSQPHKLEMQFLHSDYSSCPDCRSYCMWELTTRYKISDPEHLLKCSGRPGIHL